MLISILVVKIQLLINLEEVVLVGVNARSLCYYLQVMVFMTHMSNYGNDRLGLYTFESVVKFVQCWTNLQLKSLPPLDLAKLYFKMYPDEEDPVWRVSHVDDMKKKTSLRIFRS